MPEPLRPVNVHWRWLLLVPVVAVVWVPWFNRIEPTLFGFPFFYWYQLAWVAISAAITAVVYLKTKPRDSREGEQ